MGDQERMDSGVRFVTLYSSQPGGIVEKLRRGETHYAKIALIREKYGEVADVFTNAYRWYAERASTIVPRPDEAESGIWAYADIGYLDRDEGCRILGLKVPADKAVFFLMSDWNKVLNLRYVGRSPAEEREFEAKLLKHGVRYEGDVYLKPFYPLLKGELLRSWEALFRHDRDIRQGGGEGIPDIQAGLWELRREWVADWDC